MPPPQCPECGRFLATAFVQQITVEAAPCPRCGTALYLGDGTVPTTPDGVAVDAGPIGQDAEPVEHVEVDQIDVVAQAAAADEQIATESAAAADDQIATESAAADEGGDDLIIDLDDDGPVPPVAVNASVPTAASAAAQDEQAPAAATPAAAPAAAAPAAHEPAAAESVRPVDLAEDGASRDPLAGWDVGPAAVPITSKEPDPTVLAAGAGAGLLVGLLLGGRGHRGLGALLGTALGALLARLRG